MSGEQVLDVYKFKTNDDGMEKIGMAIVIVMVISIVVYMIYGYFNYPKVAMDSDGKPVVFVTQYPNTSAGDAATDYTLDACMKAASDANSKTSDSALIAQWVPAPSASGSTLRTGAKVNGVCNFYNADAIKNMKGMSGTADYRVIQTTRAVPLTMQAKA